MPRADVVVIGAGLSGLTAAIGLADAGASVIVLAKGHAATHWASGGLDVAAVPGSRSPRDALDRLKAVPDHPYASLAQDLVPALEWLLSLLAQEGLAYVGDVDTPLMPVPTAIGGTRSAAILPVAQAPARAPWTAGSELVVCGPAGFKDFWPDAIAASLERPEVWGGSEPPGLVRPLTIALPGLAGRHNLNAIELARRFDDPGWRDEALEAIARPLERYGSFGAGSRMGLPAVLGLDNHGEAFEAVRRRLPIEPFEIPLVPPSIPGIRLFAALRSALRRRRGRIQIGESVSRIETAGRRVTRVIVPAATREYVVAADAIVLATGGFAGGGLVAQPDGRLEEPLLALPVEAPPPERWLASDPFDPVGHPLEAAGIRTDGELRPIDAATGRPLFDNVRVVGSLLAGQRYLRERCGDGVAIASGWHAAQSLSRRAPELAAAGHGTER